MIQADLYDLSGALKNWFNEWPFTGFLTLTWPCGEGRWRFNQEWFQNDLERLLQRFDTQYEAATGGLGVAVLSGFGTLHAHVLILKEDGIALTQQELAYIKRKFRYNAEAKPIYDRETLCGYVASAHHLRAPERFKIVFKGCEVLKQSRRAEASGRATPWGATASGNSAEYSTGQTAAARPN